MPGRFAEVPATRLQHYDKPDLEAAFYEAKHLHLVKCIAQQSHTAVDQESAHSKPDTRYRTKGLYEVVFVYFVPANMLQEQ